ncbi:hypothetical protein PTSG_02829 [Salpingoeca rosetta]|uniref:Uncharacterized protein n=1 Tax=Salpingoeca rosetta (strain ATCC 50818 / BSB-021) TaxID=946362 RepID=F2U3G1_SALR5|nr:uncharacterized protein PTSG_02829 [Salpingoeca rosetta]EGD82155.1 hypothetical protein PTSG_02829 [Salpingoeca rosetta]|eukprot:XP_004996338.1 hypothetical protein PTSG_02829 [Salpingoeca rosetta]
MAERPVLRPVSMEPAYNEFVVNNKESATDAIEERRHGILQVLKDTFDAVKGQMQAFLDAVHEEQERNQGSEFEDHVRQQYSDDDADSVQEVDVHAGLESDLEDFPSLDNAQNAGDVRAPIADVRNIIKAFKKHRADFEDTFGELQDLYPLEADLDFDGLRIDVENAAEDLVEGADAFAAHHDHAEAAPGVGAQEYGEACATAFLQWIENSAREALSITLLDKLEELLNTDEPLWPLYVVTAGKLDDGKKRIMYVGKSTNYLNRFKGGHTAFCKLLHPDFSGETHRPFEVTLFDVTVNDQSLTGLDNSADLLTCVEQSTIWRFRSPLNSADQGRENLKLEKADNAELAKTLTIELDNVSDEKTISMQSPQRTHGDLQAKLAP